MNFRYFAATLLLASIFLSCRTSTCSVDCGGNIFIIAVGFTKSQLDSANITIYTQNHGQYTQNYDSRSWSYPSPNDSTSDTLINHAFSLASGMNGTSFEINIPSTNQTFMVKNINCGGDVAENQPCNEGSPTPGYCKSFPYLSSYNINGTIVNFPVNKNPTDTTGYIYLHT